MRADEKELIESHINALAADNRGRLTPDLVLSDASDPASPTHSCFEWDDGKAAYQHRLDQARALIRSVRVVVRTETTVVRSVAYVRDPDARTEQGYVSVASLKANRAKAMEAVMYEAKRAESAMARARDVSDALGLSDAIDNVIGGIRDVREKLVE